MIDVSVNFDRYVGADPNGHQLGVSIQSCVKLRAELNLGDDLCIFTSLHITDSRLNLFISI